MQLGENLRDLFTVVFSPDGRTVVAGGADFVLYSWDVHTGEAGIKYVGHSGWVNQIAFDPETETMVSSSTSIILWNFETGKVSNTISRNVADFAFAPHGGLAVPDIIDTQVGNPPYRQLFHTPVIRVLDVNTGKTLYRYNLDVSDPDPGAITSVEFSPDGEKIAVGGPEDSLWFGNTTSSNLGRLLQTEVAEITDIAFSPDSQILAVAYTDATIRLWDAKSGEFLSSLKGHLEEVRSVAFSPDGTALASASDDDTIIIWHIK